MREVERLCDKIVMMKQGQIVDSGTCSDLIKKHGRENLEDTFLKIARSKMSLSKIFALSLRHIYLIKDPSQEFRPNILANYSNISLGFHFKIFY